MWYNMLIQSLNAVMLLYTRLLNVHLKSIGMSTCGFPKISTDIIQQVKLFDFLGQTKGQQQP